MGHPNGPVCNWLFSKFRPIQAGLNAQDVKDAFYPTNYSQWRNRRILNLTWQSITEDMKSRGPPPPTRKIIFQSDVFKFHCLQVKGTMLSENEIQNSFTEINLEDHHFKYRYRTFDGNFPTFKWVISLQGDRNHMKTSQRSIYVLFAYSDTQHSIVPNGTLAVELTAWLEDLQRINGTHHALPAIVGNTRPPSCRLLVSQHLQHDSLQMTH